MSDVEPRPLAGKRIVVTRPAGQAPGLAERLRALGAEVVSSPSIRIAPPDDFAPLDQAIERLSEYDWVVLTSANGVEALVARMQHLQVEAERLQRLKLGAIGPATAESLAAHGLRPDFVPSAYVAERIVAEIGDVRGRRVLLPRAAVARDALARGLREKGALVDEVPAYRTLPAEAQGDLIDLLRRRAVDAVTFTSSSTVRFLLDGLETQGLQRSQTRELLARTAVVCIGPVTAEATRQEGLRVDAVADEYTTGGLIAALVDYFNTRSAPAARRPG